MASRIDVISYRTKSHEIKINKLLNPHNYVPFDPTQFMWSNQDGATIAYNPTESYEPKTSYMRCDANGGGDKLHMLVKASPVPAGDSLSVDLSFAANLAQDQYSGCGMVLRNSLSNTMIVFGVLFDGSQTNYWVARYTNETSWGGDYRRVPHDAPVYNLRFVQTADNRQFKVANDGINFENFFVSLPSDYLVYDQIGVCLLTNTGNPLGYAGMTVLNWKN